MSYPIEFFEIQEFFARHVSRIASTSLEESLLKYTSYYKRIGIPDWDFNPQHSLWKLLLARSSSEEKSPARTAFELCEGTQSKMEGRTKRFGCMGFDCRGTVVIMHFKSNLSSEQGPLSRCHIADRLAELKEMFAYISRFHPDAQFVEGFSWLYNYESYRRLFPPEYTDNMELISETPVRLHSAWGQFIDSLGNLNLQRSTAFGQRVNAATTFDELFAAFPLKTYKPRADIKFFYSFYGV